MRNITKSILLALLGLILAAPVNAAKTKDKNNRKSLSSWTVSNWKIEGVKIESQGKIVFSDDYKDVKSISEDGFLKISMVSFGMRRKLIIRPEDGQLIYTYYEGRKEVPFEPEGRQWMEDVLPSVVRSTGIDAEARVNRIFKKEGISGFLKEFEATKSDYNRANMIKYLLSNHDLNIKELEQLIRSFPYDISSNYELAKLLKRYNTIFMQNQQLSAEFFQALQEVSSDYETAQVLKQVMRENQLRDKLLTLYIEAMDNISSDYEKTNIIKQLILSENFTMENSQQLLETIQQISSDYERVQIVNTLLKHKMIDSSNIDQLMEIVNEISSNYSYCEILKDLADYTKLDQERFDYLLEGSKRISSSYDLGQFFKSLILSHQLNKNQQIKLLQIAPQRISSSYDLSKLLILAARSFDLNDQQIYTELIKAARGVSSEYEYGKVMKAIDSARQSFEHNNDNN